MSCDSNLILSCSADPPIIQVHNRTLATTISLTPRASSAPVNICAFHPNRRSVFALAFNDGVLAAYDYSKISGAIGAKKDGRVGIGHGNLKEIHTFRHLHDPSITGTSGITGLQFLPGYRSRAVTVGEDGRAFLLDFDMRDTLGSWHIGAPATGLAVRSRSGDPGDPNGYLIAVGAIHGRCYVYDGHGNKIGEQIADTEGGKVVGVEWVSGDRSYPIETSARDPRLRSQAKPHPSETPKKVRETPKPKTRNSPSTENLNPSQPNTSTALHQAGLSARGSRRTPDADETRTISSPKLATMAEPQWSDLKETATQGYMRLFSPVKKKRPARSSSVDGRKGNKAEQESNPQLRALQLESQRSAISAPPLWNETGKKPIQKPLPQVKEGDDTASEGVSLPIPGRYPGGARSASTPITQTSITVRRVASGPLRDLPVSDKASDGKLLSDIRSVRAKVLGESSGKPARSGLALFAPYMPSKVRKGVSKSPETVVNTPVSHENQIGDIRQKSGKERAEDRVDGSGDEGVRRPAGRFEASPTTALEAEEQGQEQGTQDISFGEDIWLAEGKEARRSRKRKQSTPDANETILDSTTHTGSRRAFNNGSNSGSLKSRKTVSWGDEPGGPSDDTTPRAQDVAHLPEITTSGPSDRQSTVPALGGAPPRKPLHVAPPSQTFLSASSSFDETSFHTPRGEEAPERPVGPIELSSALRSMAMDMRIAFKSEIEDLRAELGRRFHTQDALLRSLRDEVQIVRRENQELREQLSGERMRK